MTPPNREQKKLAQTVLDELARYNFYATYCCGPREYMPDLLGSDHSLVKAVSALEVTYPAFQSNKDSDPVACLPLPGFNYWRQILSVNDHTGIDTYDELVVILDEVIQGVISFAQWLRDHYGLEKPPPTWM